MTNLRRIEKFNEDGTTTSLSMKDLKIDDDDNPIVCE
jgi:hypothetical protein